MFRIQVALKLVHQLASMEGRDLFSHGKNVPDKKWLLDTYAECLHAVKGFRKYG